MSNKNANFTFGVKKVPVVNISTRFSARVDRTNLHKGKPEKRLISPLKKSGGRNNTGRITIESIGGGHKQNYRHIDFKRRKDNMLATVLRLEYDPCRSAFIALIQYEDGEKSYIIAPKNLKPGMQVISGDKVTSSIGNTMSLRNIGTGKSIHNVEQMPNKGGIYAKSAGTFGTILGFSDDGDDAIVMLSSRNIKRIPADARATIGEVSNPNHRDCVGGTAGNTRHKGYTSVEGCRKNQHGEKGGGRNDRKRISAMRGKKTVKIKNHWRIK